jgi:hypothetical protein
VFATARERVEVEIRAIEEWPVDFDHLRRRVTKAVAGAIRSGTARRPVVVPIILEI